ncbi:MAG: histidinol dehydrogenase, partial [Chloroflexota bacterium]|nr:histidinol dehydrogenase [Chloroflexota bacterium]
MQLKQVRGLAAADSVLTRIDPLDLSSLPDAALQRTRDLFGSEATPESSVLQMLREVRAEGDAAVRRYARLLDGADLDELQVPASELEDAWRSTPDDLKRALEMAAERITRFHEATLPSDWVAL